MRKTAEGKMATTFFIKGQAKKPRDLRGLKIIKGLKAFSE